MNSLVCAARALLVVLCLHAAAADAGVVIGGTRVVFPAARGEVTLRLSNQGDAPALVEAWIDRGNPQSTPDQVATPFLISPPLFRMEPHKDQSLRVLFTEPMQTLPSDRESLFWLNVLEVPPKPSGAAAGSNRLQFAIRSRLKLFYRPPDLPGDALQAAGRLTFTATVADGGVVLDVRNPTPYYVTISKAVLQVGGKPAGADTGMVAPFGQLRLAVKGLAMAPAAGTPLAWATINDYGAADAHKGVVGP